MCVTSTFGQVTTLIARLGNYLAAQAHKFVASMLEEGALVQGHLSKYIGTMNPFLSSQGTEFVKVCYI